MEEKKEGKNLLGKLKDAAEDNESQIQILSTFVRLGVVVWAGFIITLNYVELPVIKKAGSSVTLNAVIPHGSKSRVSNASIHSRQYELNHYNDPGDSGGNNYHNLWVCIKQMVRRQHNPHLNVFWRNSGFRFGIQHDNSWKRLYTRNSNTSSQSSTRSNRDRKRNRHYFYYYIIISILTIGGIPAYAEASRTIPK